MGKRRLTLKVRIPPYDPPRREWRLAINSEVIAAAEARGVAYESEDKLEIIVTLYMDRRQIRWHDVDNRLKDIMDALQGRAGGSKSKHVIPAVIPNDHQIYKVAIEKRSPPKQSLGMGHLVIRKYRG